MSWQCLVSVYISICLCRASLSMSSWSVLGLCLDRVFGSSLWFVFWSCRCIVLVLVVSWSCLVVSWLMSCCVTHDVLTVSWLCPDRVFDLCLDCVWSCVLMCFLTLCLDCVLRCVVLCKSNPILGIIYPCTYCLALLKSSGVSNCILVCVVFYHVLGVTMSWSCLDCGL